MAYRSFVALGDSFTEGLNDPLPEGAAQDPNGITRYRGWADRVAERLAELEPGFRYANLAVRGKLIDQIIADQVPRAIEMKPDLISFCAGGNDLLRPGSDPDRVAKKLATAVRDLRKTGAEVIMFTGTDPRDTPLMRMGRGKFAVFFMHTRAIADMYGCHLVDLWPMQSLRDPRAWSEDRLHLNAEGHRLVAAKVLDVLGVPSKDDWRKKWPPLEAVDPWTKRREDTLWLKNHVAPWIGRRIRGVSSGDGVPPKRPELAPLG
ncbi:SGNH/GDSL hydrolase family protein [Thermobispora bispora]|jgi:lysophospholipase L1-like esterase|uniref:Lipolytic protein G-D-S-L family n=1 Tax=Thermobispora bispora (strain ATCC 19993 / DSM 43833 / CBS 139.67 / JCM 10125 / KCTC 9307 / NBRC 14880 / R51) TaxID=469371 RepID=D6Y341_THEBD|nr:SGNH/GDSL hydrolase family protein [Thermobispora bispora]ADG88916.1 lipolytic protein G-D-S-L family [Thermobispora bispora DSM 43833]MDI9579888.1 SGNH/GDSL hydrolase family protein [Thermobispora sp.]QSI48660.1 SGNH/GDSL hydrolase family protein [Thermobispora bispora]